MPSSEERLQCVYLGEETGLVSCITCSADIKLKVYTCEVHDICTLRKKVPGIQCCAECKDYARAEGARAIIRQQRKRGVLYFWPKPKKADILVFLPHSAGTHWIHRYTPTSASVLKKHGVTLVSCQGSNRWREVSQAIEATQPRVVVNSAGILGWDVVKRMHDQGIRVLTVLHGCISELGQDKSIVSRMQYYESYSLIATPSERDSKATGWIHLPNPVPALRRTNFRRELHETPRVSVFARPGAVKNVLRQMVGAVRAGCRLYVLDSLRDHAGWLVAAHRKPVHVIPRMVWPRLMRFISKNIDIGIQVSLDETFNYISIEHALQGIPVVTSRAISWCRVLEADPLDPDDIASKVALAVEDYGRIADECYRRAVEVREENNSSYAQVMLQILNWSSK